MHWTTYCIDGSQALLSSLLRKSQSASRGGLVCIWSVCWLLGGWLRAWMHTVVLGETAALHEQEQGLACFKL